MKPITPLVLAILAATTATCSAGNCHHLYYRPHHVQYAVQQPVVLFSVGDSLLLESAVEKALQRREALQAQRPQQQAASAFQTKCVRCHNGTRDDTDLDLRLPITAEVGWKVVGMLGEGIGVPDKMKSVVSALTPEDKGAITRELLTLSARPVAVKPEPPVVVPEPEAGVLR